MGTNKRQSDSWSHRAILGGLCPIIGNCAFVETHAIATRRALRAILKSADLCAQAAERGACLTVDRKSTPRFDNALQAIQAPPITGGRKMIPRIGEASMSCA